MRWSAVEILSSSPRVLGWIAKEIEGSGKEMPGSTIGCASSESVSPVIVSLSLAITPISPGPSASTGFWVLPESQPRWPIRSRLSRLALKTWLSDRSVPE